MKRKDGISVIVPCYNTEKYLKDCVDSLLNQQIENYEILLIDDGSTDSTGKILDEYKKKPKIRIFHKKNGGSCSAKNYGIEKACYTYLTFVDSDDWVSNDFLKEIYQKAQEGYDAISFNLYFVLERYKTGDTKKCFNRENENKIDFILSSTNNFFASMRCYHYRLFEKVKYPSSNMWYENITTAPILLSYANKVVHIDNSLYYYRQREESISNEKTSHKILDILDGCERILKLGNPNYKEELEYVIYRILVNFLHSTPKYADEYLAYANKYKHNFFSNHYIKDYIDSNEKNNLFEQKLIPKKIHYCWFGGNHLNELAKQCIESWKKYAPDYEIIEWNESNCNINENAYVKEAYEHKKWAFVSDYFRLKVINEQGGFYMDTDMELQKPIDFFRLNNIFFPIETNNINSCIFGAIKGHPFLKECLDTYQNDHFIKSDGSLDVERTIVVRLTDVLEKQHIKVTYDGNTYQVAPSFFVYSPDVLLINIFNGKNVTIHHYDASWLDFKDAGCSYQYEVMKYYFLHKNEPHISRYKKIKKKLLVWIKKVLKTILPSNIYNKIRRMYRKFKRRSL